MSDAEFQSRQYQHRYDAHVKPINELVDRLRDPHGRGWVPYVAPVHGGVDAWILSILRDPGPATQEGVGSGFLCIENADPTAEQQCVAFANVGVTASDVVPWNAYPWYVNRKLTAAERQAGVSPLAQLLALLPRVTVVLLQGRDAADTWRRFERDLPTALRDREIEVIATYHPGRQALWARDPAERERRRQARNAAYLRAAARRPKLRRWPGVDIELSRNDAFRSSSRDHAN